MFLNEYPYTDFHELNLDFILHSMEALKKAFNEFTGANSLTFADPILWNIANQYQKNTIVLSNSGDAYLSIKPVPTGIQLSNADYWLEVFNFAVYVRTANENLTVNVEQNTTRSSHVYNVNDWLLWDDVLYKVIAAIAVDDLLIENINIEHFTVEDFIKAWITYANGLIVQYKNEIDASESAYRLQLAQDIADTTASLQAQLNAAIAGITVDSEVINARIGADGITYDTLGDAIRGQVSGIYKKFGVNDRPINLFAFRDTWNNPTYGGVDFTLLDNGLLHASGTGASNTYIALGYFTLPVGRYIVSAAFGKDRLYCTLRNGTTNAYIADITDKYILDVSDATFTYMIAANIIPGMVYSDNNNNNLCYPLVMAIDEYNEYFEHYSDTVGNQLYNSLVNINEIRSMITPIVMNSGSYNYDTGTLSVGNPLTITNELSYVGSAKAKVTVNAGDVVHIRCKGGNANRALVFTDTSNVIKYASPVNFTSEYDLTFSEDGILYINSSDDVRKCYFKTDHVNNDLCTKNALSNKMLFNELFHADYIGAFHSYENATSMIIIDDVDALDPNTEHVTAYMCYESNEWNLEGGTAINIAAFPLQEPAARVNHEIARSGNTITVGGTPYTLPYNIGGGVIYDYDDDHLYLTFTTPDGTLAMLVDKSNFSISSADYITIDGVSKNTGILDYDWSSCPICYYDGYYYRSWRGSSDKVLLIRSTDLFAWTTWLDISSLLTFSAGNMHDETCIDIDSDNGILYFAVRGNPLTLGKLAITATPSISDVTYNQIIGCLPTRPSIRLYNGRLYFIGNSHPISFVMNSFTLNRGYILMLELDTNFSILNKFESGSPIGGNYNILLAYKSSLFVGLNLNKQLNNNTNSLNRCGVYFTPIYAIFDFV